MYIQVMLGAQSRFPYPYSKVPGRLFEWVSEGERKQRHGVRDGYVIQDTIAAWVALGSLGLIL